MSVLRPRSRLVYFRVSEDEYQQFNHVCAATGARSLSDLARSAMKILISDNPAGRKDRVSAKLDVLEEMVRDLNRKFENISTSLHEWNDLQKSDSRPETEQTDT